MILRHVILLACLASATAWGETIFRSTRADGSTFYSDTPIQGATVIEQFQLVPMPSPAELARAKEKSAQEQRRIEDADKEINAARAAVRQAQQQLHAGIEPLTGERTSFGGGRINLNAAYYQRMQRLEKAMSDAVIRLERAYALRGDLR